VLVGFADDSTDLDVSSLLAEMGEIEAKSDVNLTDSAKMLEDSVESMTIFNTSEILDLISDIQDSLEDIDVSSFTDQLTSTQESIDEVDFKGFIDSLDDNLDAWDRINENNFVEKWIETFGVFRTFMFNDQYFKTYLRNVNDESLNAVVDARGPSEAFAHIGNIVVMILTLHDVCCV
jgi:hypothetical protein